MCTLGEAEKNKPCDSYCSHTSLIAPIEYYREYLDLQEKIQKSASRWKI